MTVLWPVAERNLSSLWCSAASIYSNSRKKDRELKKTISHIIFPLTSLLLSISLSLSLSQGEQAGVSTLWAKFTEAFAPRFRRILHLRDVCVIYQRDTAAWRRSLPVIWGTFCVPLAFMHMHSKEACTNNTNNKRRYNNSGWVYWIFTKGSFNLWGPLSEG